MKILSARARGTLRSGGFSPLRDGLLGVILLTLAQAADAQVTVDVAIFPPHVMESPGRPEPFEGFDIDLWVEIARIAGIDYNFRRIAFDQLLEEMANAEADVGLAGITINEKRETVMDFSHPYMRSGLRILVNAERQTDPLAALRTVISSNAIRWLSYLLLFLAVCSHALYFAERGKQAIDRRYFPGIFEAAWCVVATMTTVGYGDITPRGWPGRIVAFLVMMLGIGLFGVVIAELSSGLTLQRLASDIEGPEDLRGRTVATVAGSTSVEFLQQYGADVLPVTVIDEAYGKLHSGEADAVVFDSPTLLYYVRTHHGGRLKLAGELFEPQSYGIAFPSGSALREPVNRALLQVRESGAYDRIYEKWFGDEP